MNVQWTCQMPAIRNGRFKRSDAEEPLSKFQRRTESPSEVGCLSISPRYHEWSTPFNGTPIYQGPSKICQFLLIPMEDRNGVNCAFNVNTGEEFVCKVYSMTNYRERIRAYGILSTHRNISSIRDIILGDKHTYVFLEKDYGDMHMFMKSSGSLSEERVSQLFRQAASAVAHCHQAGVVLGDLKLRKFVFTDQRRTHLKLEGLDDCHILEGNDDAMSEKHGCPAYISPEILSSSESYSGKRSDVWSLGIMLYTLLVGHYPFHDSDPGTLFAKIRRGQVCLPERLSPNAKCLVRSLLRREPLERLTAAEILLHPWFQTAQERGSFTAEAASPDQAVPS